MASVLIAFGAGLAGLGLILHHLTPALGRVTFIAGLAGGSLCLLWGLAALAGLQGRSWAVLTMVATAFALLSQVVTAWMASSAEGSASLAFRFIVTAMMLLTISMLIYLLHGERPAEFYHRGTTRPDNPASGTKEGQSREKQSRR